MEEYQEYESPYDKLRNEPPDKETWKATLRIADSRNQYYGRTATIYPDDYPQLVFYAQFSDIDYGAALLSPVPEGNYTVTIEGIEGEKHITLVNFRMISMEWL